MCVYFCFSLPASLNSLATLQFRKRMANSRFMSFTYPNVIPLFRTMYCATYGKLCPRTSGVYEYALGHNP
jgi:hypothetical protein